MSCTVSVGTFQIGRIETACYTLRTRVVSCPAYPGVSNSLAVATGGEPCSLLHSARCDRACPPPSFLSPVGRAGSQRFDQLLSSRPLRGANYAGAHLRAPLWGAFCLEQAQSRRSL